MAPFFWSQAVQNFSTNWGQLQPQQGSSKVVFVQRRKHSSNSTSSLRWEQNPQTPPTYNVESWGVFLESPETFRAYFGWHNYLCIFKTKASRGTKLCSYFYFYSLYNIREDQLYRISRPEFDEWLFGPEKLSGLSRNGPLNRTCDTLTDNKTYLVYGSFPRA